jgi:lipoyl(octanoyl) transferase
MGLEFLYWGLGSEQADYAAAWDLQRRLHAEVAEGTRPDTVILLEHASVYTAGKRTEPEERPTDGTPVIDVDRGGKITWHGPGQLVGYPLVRLPEAVYVVDYVRRLEEALIKRWPTAASTRAGCQDAQGFGCPLPAHDRSARSRLSAYGSRQAPRCMASLSTSIRT